MITNMHTTKWTPVDLVGCTRRAYGRQIFFESDGGTLRSTLKVDEVGSGQLYLRLEVDGRMLVQVFVNGQQVFEDLVAHGEVDQFVDLKLSPKTSIAEVEVHLIPATFGTVKIAQDLRHLPVATPIKREPASVA